MGNSTELREVLLNIINNALDAMPGGGRIAFRAWMRDDNVFLSITDTGEGMSHEVRRNIFDPFFTTKMPGGTGLGMSVSYGIIKTHGGNMEVESDEGKGTTITIGLPACEKTGCSDRDYKQNEGIETGALHILIVDDEPRICDFLCEFLTLKGQKVTSVSSGTEAIKRLKSESFDLVLCDLVMPEVGGRAVIKAMDALGKRPKVGLITGWCEKLEFPKDKGLRVDFIVKKPVDFPILAQHISRCFADCGPQIPDL